MQKSENNNLNSPEEDISRIFGKLQQLLKQYESLQKDNEKNKKTIESFAKRQEEYEANLYLLQQQNLVLKASVASLNESDKKEIEHKINNYIRSIDKCISLLSQ